MNKTFIVLAIVFSVFDALACTSQQSLKVAREHVLKESPKGGKITLKAAKDVFVYTAILVDEHGAYTGSGTLKVNSDCSVQTISSSSSNQSASGTSSSSSSSSK